MEHTGESAEISFLDTLLTLRANGAYTTELYINPAVAGVFRHPRLAGGGGGALNAPTS